MASVKQKLGLLLVFGDRLPPAGCIFLAPVKGHNLTKADIAMRICAKRWPNPLRKGGKYDGLWTDGSLSSCDEEKDRVEFQRIQAWNGCKYEWDFKTERFNLVG